MTNIDLFFLTLFISGLIIVSYGPYASKKGWPIGLLFTSTSPFLLIGGTGMFGSPIVAFFYIEWYLVLIGIVGGFLISFILTGLLKKNSQFFSILLFVLSWLFLLIKF